MLNSMNRQFIKDIKEGKVIHPVQINIDKIQFLFNKVVELADDEEAQVNDKAKEVVTEFTATVGQLFVGTICSFMLSSVDPRNYADCVADIVAITTVDIMKQLTNRRERDIQ